MNTKEKIAKSKPSEFLKATTAIERDRVLRDRMSDATNLLVRKNFDDLINKDKCIDIFKDIKDHEEQIPVSSQDWVRLKMKRCGYQNILKKLGNIVKSGLVTGAHYIMTKI